MGGLERAPQAPRRSSGPGEAGALVDPHARSATEELRRSSIYQGAPGATIGARLADAVRTLADAGIEGARRDAEWLLASMLGLPRFEVYATVDHELSEEALSRYDAALRRRVAGEPLQQILGWEEFHGLRLRVTPDVLVPRPETEILVEWVLELLPRAPARVIDVGSGSGCIACALGQARPDVTVIALDRVPAAARVTRENAAALDLAERILVAVGDLLSPLRSASVDVVVSNPPYLTSAMLEAAPREVRDHEPTDALWGGADGLTVLRPLIAEARRVLRLAGVLVVETAGGEQVDEVARFMRDAGYVEIETRSDLTGIVRFVAARCPRASSAGVARAKVGVSGAPGAPDADRCAGVARAKVGVSGAPGAPDADRCSGVARAIGEGCSTGVAETPADGIVEGSSKGRADASSGAVEAPFEAVGGCGEGAALAPPHNA